MNSVEHPHGEGNQQHCETVDQILASSSTRHQLTVRRQMKRSENFFSHPRERHDRGCGDGLVCERNTFKITDVVTRRRPCSHQFRNDLKAYRDDKQMNSATYSLSTVKAIQQVLRSRQYSQRGSDSGSQMWTYSQDRPDREHEQGRGGVQEHTSFYPHLLDIRSTSSSVCKAGALVPSPPCLGGGCGWPMYRTSPMNHRYTRNPHRRVFILPKESLP